MPREKRNFLSLIGAGAGITGGILAVGTGNFEDAGFQRGMAAVFLGGIGGVVGLVGGLIAGASASGELDIQVQGLSGPALSASLQNLNEHARYKEFR